MADKITQGFLALYHQNNYTIPVGIFSTREEAHMALTGVFCEGQGIVGLAGIVVEVSIYRSLTDYKKEQTALLESASAEEIQAEEAPIEQYS
jgi:hypothetical protein